VYPAVCRKALLTLALTELRFRSRRFASFRARSPGSTKESNAVPVDSSLTVQPHVSKIQKGIFV